VRVGELGSLHNGGIEEVADPVPGEDEVVIEIAATPVNYVDVLTMRGLYQFTPELPYTPGKGPAGVVRAFGEGVADVAVGDRVLAMAEYGGYAEAVAVDHRQVHRLPADMPFTDAASMAVAFDTAWVALRDRARLVPGETVLVLGAAGAVGHAAVQLARAMGARQVLAGVSSQRRLDEAGLTPIVDATVDLSLPDLRESIREQVLSATAGRGVDIVVDPLGGGAFDGAVRALAWRGRLCVIGFAAGRIATLKTNYVLLKNIEVSGMQISDYRRRMPEYVAEGFREMFGYYENGMITALPHRTMALDDWRTALELVESRRAGRRIVLVP
jgi:NADPH2:quinone reductase